MQSDAMEVTQTESSVFRHFGAAFRPDVSPTAPIARRQRKEASAATTAAETAQLPPDEDFVLDATLQGSYPATYVEDGTSVGDLFGFGLAVDGSDLFVGAPASRVQGNDNAGASYFFRRSDGTLPGVAWQQSQLPFVLPVAYDLTGFGHYAAGDGWAFVPLPGTPDDISGREAKDFSGELLVFRKDDCEGGAWTLVQKIANPAGPVDGGSQAFGYNVSYSHGKLLVAALEGSNKAYVYDYEAGAGQWLPAAVLELPANTSGILDVLISDAWAFIGYIETSATGAVDSAVAVFKFFDANGCEDDDNPCGYTTPGWRLTQTLRGYDNPADQLDLFGEALAIDGSTLAVGAPLDTTQAPGGAVYIFQLCDGRWLAAQKIYDDAPADQVLSGVGFGYNIALHGGVLAIADPFRDFEGTPAQGVVALYAKDRCTKEWLPTGDLFVDPDGFETEFFGAGAVVLTDDFLVVSNNLQPTFINTPPLATNNPGRVVIWRHLHDDKCKGEDDDCDKKKKRRHRKHHRRNHC
jgi:hypothetical protein